MATFAVVDLETTGNASSKKDRIIEIGIVVLKDSRVVKEFSSLVYPERDIPPFITSLTGIDDEDVSHAPLFSEIAEEVYGLFKNAYIVAHNIEFDLGFLNAELNACGFSSLNNQIIDTVELARVLIPTSPSFKLGRISEALNFGHDRPHRALSDAQVTGELLIYLLDSLYKLPERTLTHLLKVTSKLKSGFREFIEEALNRVRYRADQEEEYTLWHGIAVRKLPSAHTDGFEISENYEEWLENLYEGEEGFKRSMLDFEQREGQRKMSDLVHQSLTERRHALLEAGAGTGKSLAYLVSALYYSIKNQQRIVVSTHTTSLQNQLLKDEVPKIAEALDQPVKAELFKGRSHYISLVHFSYELENSVHDNYDEALAKSMILVWLTQTTTGDIDEIQLPSNGQQFWHKVSAEQSKKAVQLKSEASYFEWAEKKASQANIIITNHSILCLDLISSEKHLPPYDKIIIDEGHQLESVASRYFGIRLNYKELQRQLSQMGEQFSERYFKEGGTAFMQLLDRHRQAIDKAKDELNQLMRYLYQGIRKSRQAGKSKSDIGRIQYSLEDEKDKRLLETAEEMTNRFLSNISSIKRLMLSMKDQLLPAARSSSSKEPAILLNRLDHSIMICEKIENQLYSYFSPLEANENEAKWIEIEGEGPNHSLYMFSEPVQLNQILRERLFSSKQSVIVTSATLTTNRSFNFIKGSLGITNDNRLIEENIPSPYSFDQNVKLMVPNDFPNVRDNQEEFIYSVSEAIYSMAHITKGRMLVLFTSYDMLKKTYYLLKELINPEEYMIFGQGVSSGSRDRLKKNFQAFDQSILLGTSSFWEGVDIPGDDLSCLVIVRLPFQPPGQPVQSKREQLVRQLGKNPFMEYSLPEAIIRFRQGFGRLIRSSTDRGIVFICDQRIIESSYGKYFLSSIPDIPVTHESTNKLIKQMEDWL
ncbi:ATP-dependent DNA helicase DinG [Halobacillus campisalis]|uniref:3'-5' exonuclease DinG n=1 Tax=Halobacillus campisalis TaxID=435909 RepID=A0ABW2K3H7_9BACI|nr:ATP-dependent DNA helicase DinG [Halobacillus campisalis]